MSFLLASRGLAGLIGSGVFSLYGGSLSDMFNPRERAPLVALFTIMMQGAPTFGPVPASLLGGIVPWRWLMGFITFWSAIIAGLLAILPETEPTTIQKRIAKEHGITVKQPTQDLLSMWRDTLMTPISMYLMNGWMMTLTRMFLAMLWQEPIVTWTTLYHAFVYGLLFILLEVRSYCNSFSHATLIFTVGVPTRLCVPLWHVPPRDWSGVPCTLDR